jgi:hypothetical protein
MLAVNRLTYMHLIRSNVMTSELLADNTSHYPGARPLALTARDVSKHYKAPTANCPRTLYLMCHKVWYWPPPVRLAGILPWASLQPGT